ncbi:MAG TPA: zinc ribbon domain-containing protein [Desulfobacterales bacterium]
MQEGLREKFEILLKLQEVELEIDAIQSLLQALPQKLLTVEAGLEQHQQAQAAAREQLAELQRNYRALEMESKEHLGKIARSQEQLQTVKTNKEYQSMLKQIDDLKAAHSALEDRMIECLDGIDQAEAALKETRQQSEAAGIRIQNEKQQLEEESRREKARRLDMEQQRTDLLNQVNSDLLRQYQSVKATGRRGPVAVVRSAVCQACHLNIPPQMFNELLRFEKVFHCPHCERLLVPETE